MPITIPRTLILRAGRLSRLPAIRRQSTKTTDTDKFKRSFRGQLYDSTAQRIQNERAALMNAKLRSGSTEGQAGSEKVSGTLAGIFGEFALDHLPPSPKSGRSGFLR